MLNVTEPFLSITPDSIQQGEPALITVEGLTSTSSVKSFTINNIPLVMFLHNDRVTALLGVDLRAIPGTYPLVLTFKDGKQIRENLIINERPLVKVPFVIPEKLGGNTRASERELISTLAAEAKIINALPTGSEKLWTLPFRSPLKGALVVSDAYGYTRIIGKSTMPHKGVDLNAPMGTSVYAMNRGMIIFTNYLRNYGNTIIIDHGIGLQTVYIHLSEINVTEKQIVEKGELIGQSGDTGYVLNPHLHLSVKIWDISIDPIKFLELLGSKN
ncbi:MAG: M23 family metallopeptidase [bacterium]|nr:M23 family metallopeptidase [bacterium]